MPYTLWSQKTANWTATDVWNDVADGSGTYRDPGDGDTCHVKAGHVITQNVARIPVSGTLAVLDAKDGALAATNGYLSIPMNTLAADADIYATSILGGTVDFLQVTGAAPTYTLRTHGAVTGGSVANADGLYHNSTAMLNHAGGVTGGSNASCHGFQLAGDTMYTIVGDIAGGATTGGYGVRHTTGTVLHTGSITGASNYGAYTTANWTTNTGPITGGSTTGAIGLSAVQGSGETVQVNCNVTGGSASGAYGVYDGGTTGAIVNITGDIQGGSHASGNGLYRFGNGSTCTVSGRILNTTATAAACAGYSPKYVPASAKYITYPDAAGSPVNYPTQLAAANVLEGVVHGSTTGTYHEALVGEVKDTTPFGPSSTYTGTYSPGGTYAQGVAAGEAAHLAADVVTLNANLDEMIPANDSIKAAYVGVLDGTAASGGGAIVNQGLHAIEAGICA